MFEITRSPVPESMGDLVRTCEACRDAALAYRIPFISGKDSLHNQFTNAETGEVIRIPNTLLISAIAVIDDVTRCVTMDLKNDGGALYLVRPRSAGAATLHERAATHRALHRAIALGAVASCHDISNGGLLVAAAEMCIASGLGMWLASNSLVDLELFAWQSAAYLVEVSPYMSDFQSFFENTPVEVRLLGEATAEPILHIAGEAFGVQWTVDEMTAAWRGTLDW